MGDRALAAMSSSAVAKTPTDKAKTDCVAAAHLKYSETSVALYNRQGMAPTIDDIVAKRRLLEAYCVQYVRCVNPPELMMGIEFSGCLDDEDADRLKEVKRPEKITFGELRSAGLTGILAYCGRSSLQSFGQSQLRSLGRRGQIIRHRMGRAKVSEAYHAIGTTSRRRLLYIVTSRTARCPPSSSAGPARAVQVARASGCLCFPALPTRFSCRST